MRLTPSETEVYVLRHAASIRALAALVLTLSTVAGSAFAQSPDAGPNDLQGEVRALRAENAAVRELLRKMEQQQKTLLEQIDRMQRRLDGVSAAVAQAGGPSPAAEESTPQVAAAKP